MGLWILVLIIAPQNLIFHPRPRKMKFWPTKSLARVRSYIGPPTNTSFQLTATYSWRFGIPNSAINATDGLLFHTFYGEIMIKWLRIHHRRGGNSFFQPIYRETWNPSRHFVYLEVEKNLNMLLSLDNLIWGVFLPWTHKCAFLLTRSLPLLFHTSWFFFFFLNG